jgi:hypothetical protein
VARILTEAGVGNTSLKLYTTNKHWRRARSRSRGRGRSSLRRRSGEFCALLGDLLLYYGLVLSEGLLDFLVRELALLNFQLALVFQSVNLLQEHLAALLLLLVDLVRAQRRLYLLLNLQEFNLPLLHHILRHVLVIMLQLANRLQLLNVGINLRFVRPLILVSKGKE